MRLSPRFGAYLGRFFKKTRKSFGTRLIRVTKDRKGQDLNPRDGRLVVVLVAGKDGECHGPVVHVVQVEDGIGDVVVGVEIHLRNRRVGLVELSPVALGAHEQHCVHISLFSVFRPGLCPVRVDPHLTNIAVDRDSIGGGRCAVRGAAGALLLQRRLSRPVASAGLAPDRLRAAGEDLPATPASVFPIQMITSNITAPSGRALGQMPCARGRQMIADIAYQYDLIIGYRLKVDPEAAPPVILAFHMLRAGVLPTLERPFPHADELLVVVRRPRLAP